MATAHNAQQTSTHATTTAMHAPMASPTPVQAGAGAGAGAGAAGAPIRPASAAPAVLTKMQKKAAQREQRERERTAAMAAAPAAATPASAAVAAHSLAQTPTPQQTNRQSNGGAVAHSQTQQQQQQQAQQQRPRRDRDDGSHTSSVGGGSRKHERQPSGSQPPPAGLPSSGASSAPPPRYTKGLPSQYPSTSPSHAGMPASSSLAAAAALPLPLPLPPSSPPKVPFHDPPSLFRFHAQRPMPFVPPSSPMAQGIGTSAATPAAAPLPPSVVPPQYAPTNLLRLIRSLTPRFPFTHAPAAPSTSSPSSSPPVPSGPSFLLGDLWRFYDNPYGFDIDLLLDEDKLLHPTPLPSSSSSSSGPGNAAASAGAVSAQPEGTEVYYVPYLSALVLYERAMGTTVGVDGSTYPSSSLPSPPLLSWFERVSPHQRTPLMDTIASIGSCFSPPPSSPLYAQFAPFPSARLLHELSTDQLDLRRSWMAVTWYPILHDPLTSPVLAGAFLLYHGLQMEVEGAEGQQGGGVRKCPMQEANFRPVGIEGMDGVEGSVAPITAAPPTLAAPSPLSNGVTPAGPPVPSTAPSALLPVRPRPPSLLHAGSDAECEVEEDATATEAETHVAESEAGGDADGETEEEELESEAETAGQQGSTVAAGASMPPGPRRRRRIHTATKKATPLSFPSHLCPHCGDRHGPPTAPSSSFASPPPAAGAPPSAPSPPLSYLPLLGYLCHRVLPSTWFVQACHPAPAPAPSPSPAAPAGTAGAAQVQAQGQAPAPSSSSSSSLSLKQLAAQQDTVSAFNRALQTPAAFTQLSLSQPARLTHVDLSRPLHLALQAVQHPDLLHMAATNT